VRGLLLFLLFAQGSPQELIEQLRSDRAEVRERALKQLKEFGRAAIPDLEQATKDADPEVAGRATAALRVIALRERLSPELRRVFPGVEDRLAGARDSVYAEVFLEAGEHGDLKPADYESLAAAAVRGAPPDLIRNVLGQVMLARFVSAVPEIVKLLRNPDVSLAEYADQVLVSLDRPTAKAANLGLLSDHDAQIRSSCIRRLVNLGDPDVVPKIATLITDKDPYVRQWVYTTFGRLGAVTETPRLLVALQDQESSIQDAAAEALITLDPPGLAAAVRPLFRSPHESERLQAVRITAALHVKEAVPAILKQLPSADTQMRSAVAWALADLQATENGTSLLPLLKDEDEEVRTAALWAVGVLRVQEAGPSIVKLVVDSEPEVRKMACWAAGRLTLRDAVPNLLKTLAEQDNELAGAAAWPLGILQVKEALPKLLQLSKDDSMDSDAAVAAAAQLMELPPTADLISSLEAENWRVLWAFGPAARRLRPADLSAVLIKRIENEEGDEEERDLAIDAVKELRITEAVPTLLKVLRNGPAPVLTRGKAAEALARCNAREALPDVLALARQPETGFRANLFAAMADYGTKDGIPDLRKALKDPDESIVLAAVRALEQLDAREALDDLLPLLQRDDEELRAKAAGWLCHAGRREGAEALIKAQSKLIPVNALRRPDVWKKLADLRYSKDLSGSVYEILERLAKYAGLSFEWRWSGDRDSSWLLQRHLIHIERDSISGIAVLEQLLPFFDTLDVDFVLEDSLLRMVSSGSARRTFRLWLESERKK